MSLKKQVPISNQSQSRWFQTPVHLAVIATFLLTSWSQIWKAPTYQNTGIILCIRMYKMYQYVYIYNVCTHVIYIYIYIYIYIIIIIIFIIIIIRCHKMIHVPLYWLVMMLCQWMCQLFLVKLLQGLSTFHVVVQWICFKMTMCDWYSTTIVL